MNDTAYGKLGWLDMTVPDAESLKGFYEAVCGWTAEPADMGGYSDYTMMDTGGDAVGGICHTRGPNADMPPGWLPYFTVPSVEQAVLQATERGGDILVGPKAVGDDGAMAVVKDPSGAMFALWQS